MLNVVVMGAVVEPTVEDSFLIPRTGGSGHQNHEKYTAQVEGFLPKST